MPSSNGHNNLKSEDRRFIHRVAEHYTPQPLSAARRAMFDRTLEERLTGTARPPFLRPAGILIPVCAVLLLWFALSSQQPPGPDFKALTPSSAPTPLAQDTTSHPTLLAYAYYQSETQDDVLPAEYIALADAFELL